MRNIESAATYLKNDLSSGKADPDTIAKLKGALDRYKSERRKVADQVSYLVTLGSMY